MEIGLWQTLIKRKNAHKKCFSTVRHKPRDSQFWYGILRIKNTFYKYCRKKVGNGENTRFWEDWWVDDKPLNMSYPRL